MQSIFYHLYAIAMYMWLEILAAWQRLVGPGRYLYKCCGMLAGDLVMWMVIFLRFVIDRYLEVKAARR